LWGPGDDNKGMTTTQHGKPAAPFTYATPTRMAEMRKFGLLPRSTTIGRKP